jgi:rhodanese-related sulfurtransferase
MFTLATVAAGCLAAGNVGGMTVAELQRELAGATNLTVVDIRATSVFARGHIPGAINIPAPVVEAKLLPPLGRVVVCDAGLGRDKVEAAVKALSAKPGIAAEALDGGFAAWESSGAAATRAAGMRPEAPNYITYAQLKVAKPEEVVLVDLRHEPVAKANIAATGESLTDLGKEFAGMRTRKSPFGGSGATKAAVDGSSPAPLLVLIDSGDGKAEEMARALRANGIKRYAILAGGELILARHGQAGLRREGQGAPSATLNPAPGGATK